MGTNLVFEGWQGGWRVGAGPTGLESRGVSPSTRKAWSAGVRKLPGSRPGATFSPSSGKIKTEVVGSGAGWEDTETLTGDGQCPPRGALASGKRQVWHLAVVSCTKVGSWSLGFSQDVKFSSPKPRGFNLGMIGCEDLL